MKVVLNGALILPDQIRLGKAVVFDEKIIAILDEGEIKKGSDGRVAKGPYEGAEIIDAGGNYIAPGLVDVHFHGAGGDDTSDNDLDAIRRMSRLIAQYGVTSYLPTSMTYPKEHVAKTFECVRQAMEESRRDSAAWGGAEVLGCHMEGPYIDMDKVGAQNPEYVQAPDAAFTKENADVIKIVTIAPNVEGGLEYIEEVAKDTDIVLSVGHTGADYDCAMAAFEKGSNHVTHLFSAQTGLHHRNPGVVGAALRSRNVYAEVIADTFHIHPGVYQIICDCKKEHTVLITDCMRAGGMPDGEYTLGGQKVYVKGIQCTLESGVIAGSVLRLNKGVKNFKDHTDWPIYACVAAASLYPARSIGEDRRKGSIETGKDADIIIANSDFDIISTFVRGEKIYG